MSATGTPARLRYLHVSPYKARQVLRMIRGQDVGTARDTLQLCERSVAAEIIKLLDSAVANTEHNDSIPADELFVARAYADEAPTRKAWRPRARGRGTRIRHRSSHITIVVARFDDEELARRRRAEAAAGSVRTRPARRRTIRRRPPEHDHEHEEDAIEAESEARTDVEAVDESDAELDEATEPAREESE